MLIDKKTVTIHGGKKIHLLTPCKIDYNITAGHNNKGFVIILGNGSGYHYLKECFLIAASLKENEILHIPICSNESGYKEFIGDFTSNSNIYLVNYCEAQISPKGIDNVCNTKIFSNEIIERSLDIKEEYVDSWKTNRRLTVKNHKKNMIISTNRDGFINLADGAKHLSDYGDDVEYNDYPPHFHYDWGENTSKSDGVTLYYWHNE